MGVPGKVVGWMSRHGFRLGAPGADGLLRDPETGWRYQLENGVLRCLELGEDEPLPASQ
jgi:UDP-2-acetamido-3-amino-2,3-dideoxy-glucuronate N-acetyltransferase